MGTAGCMRIVFCPSAPSQGLPFSYLTLSSYYTHQSVSDAWSHQIHSSSGKPAWNETSSIHPSHSSISSVPKQFLSHQHVLVGTVLEAGESR